MAEVLSQSQIDALLNAVRSGEKDLDKSNDEEKKYRKYDFYRPRKFTKDHIKMLNSVFEKYTRLINSRLNTLLRTSCEVSVDTIEEQRYYEFSNALTEGDVLSLSTVDIKGKREESSVLFYLSTSLGMMMMDRMLGGEGDLRSGDAVDYTYTDLELQLYETLVKDLISVLGISWENYLPMNFDYERTEVNPTLVQLIGMDETVVLVDMKLQLSGGSGRISVCLPGMILTNVFNEINRENPVRKVTGEDSSEDIFERLRDSSLDIVAQLGATQLSLNDVYHLSVGDVIDLGHSKDSPVYLEIGGYSWFAGRMGTYKKNMAVKIDEVCYQAEQRSE